LRTIKRYANRKLYDPQTKRYVSLAQVGALIAAGERLRVICHVSGGDVTDVTLSQLVVAELQRCQAARQAGNASGPPSADHLSWIPAAGSGMLVEAEIAGRLERALAGDWMPASLAQELRRRLDDVSHSSQANPQPALLLLASLLLPTRTEYLQLIEEVDELVAKIDGLMKGSLNAPDCRCQDLL